MRILIVTPLYPPDIASHAPYVKELVSRLSTHHQMSVLTYNHIPEHVPGVRIYTVPKRLPALIRLTRFAYALWKHAKRHDVVYIQNGPSVELPFILVSFFIKTRTILRLGDEVALCKAKENSIAKILLALAVRRARSCITHPDSEYSQALVPTASRLCTSCPRPHMRPEVSPFIPVDEQALSAYTESWDNHCACIERLIVKP